MLFRSRRDRARQIVHLNWRARSRRGRYTATAWTLPALATLTAFLFLRLPVFSSGVGTGLGLAVAGALLAFIIVAQYCTLDPSDPAYRPAGMALSLVIYLLALGLYAAIYAPKVRSLLSATAVAVVTVVLALEVLRREGVEARRLAIYAGITGLILGQITWALNYWVVNALAGGAILLLGFYLLTGLAQNHLSGQLSRRVVAEFGAVATVSLLVVLYSLRAI